MATNKLGVELYKILSAKEYGYSLTMYDADGEGTTTPLTAKWIYIKPVNFMIQLPNVEENDRPEMYFWKTQGEMDGTLGQLLKRVKQAANQFGIGLTINDFSKENTPKQYSKIIKRQNEENSLTEGFGTSGTVTTSYYSLPNARLVVEHTSKINPDVKGARARNIKSIYIENANTERYMFPNKHLASAKAMTRHINEGGEWFDKVGTRIKEAYLNLKSLKHLSECTNKTVNSASKKYYSELKEEISKMKGPRGYQSVKDKYISEVRVPQHVLEKYACNLKNTSGLVESEEVLEAYKTYAMFNYRENKLNEELNSRVISSCNVDDAASKKIAQHITKGIIIFVDPVNFTRTNNDQEDIKNLIAKMSDSTNNEVLNIVLHSLYQKECLTDDEIKFVCNVYKSLQMNLGSSKDNIIL